MSGFEVPGHEGRGARPWVWGRGPTREARLAAILPGGAPKPGTSKHKASRHRAGRVPEDEPPAMRYSARTYRGGGALARKTEFPVSLAGLSRALRAGEVSPVEVTETLLGGVELDRTNAFITVTAERIGPLRSRSHSAISPR